MKICLVSSNSFVIALCRLELQGFDLCIESKGSFISLLSSPSFSGSFFSFLIDEREIDAELSFALSCHTELEFLVLTDKSFGREKFSFCSYSKCFNLFSSHNALASVVMSSLKGKSNVCYDYDVSGETSVMASGSAFSDFMSRLKLASKSDACILLLGECGTGKSWLAHKIHQLSGRQGAFLQGNITSYSSSLFESEMFGTVPGAYTDADDKMGVFEKCNNGTLFLDEIGELPLELQPKLLSVVEESVFYRVGCGKRQVFTGRLVFATNKDLKKCVEDGSFRLDLFSRISVVSFVVPPLREHKDDIPKLAKGFAAENGKTLASDALARLCAYNYKKSNIRELKYIVQRSCIFCRNNELGAKDIIFSEYC